jgi:L-lactate dehydrogenase
MAAFALQCSGVASHLCLVDVNRDLASGQATDLLHGTCLTADQRVTVGDLTEAATCQVIVITAGLRRKPEESRLDLINRNVDLFLEILGNLRQAGLREDSYLVVVSNPVDVLTWLAVKHSGLPWQRVIGLGTLLDTARLRSYLARRLKVPASQVSALVLGEHGDSMVAIWSSATIAGLPVGQWPECTPGLLQEVLEETRAAGAALIRLKGGSGFAVGLCIRELVECLILDRRRILPVSTLLQGQYGLRDVCLSVATEVGCGGVRRHIEVPLPPKERLALEHSARTLRETIQQVEARLGKGVRPAALPQSPRVGQRSIPRSAWQPSLQRR